MVVESQPWLRFLERSRPSVDWQGVGPILCLDPGETTGWAIFEKGDLKEFGQEGTPDPPEMSAFLHAFIDMDLFEVVVYEEYRVRGNKFKEHVGSEVVTIQNIGAIKVVADEFNRDLVKQTASQAKAFANDSKLRHWGLHAKGLKHANDAIRHGVYYLLFKHGRSKPNHGGTGDSYDQDLSTGRDSET